MKRIIGFTILLLSFYSTHALALLPPYYQTAREITAILNDTRVAEIITSGRVIYSIVKTDSGYTITAGTCSLEVKVTYLPPKNGMVGPAIFELEPAELKC